MAREKIYNAETLPRAINKYFTSISRTVTAMEKYATGEKDADGHVIYGERKIENDAGKPIKYRQYIIAPSMSGLCLHLGISRDTWSAYARSDDLGLICQRAKERVEAYLEQELIMRPGKTRGIEFNLSQNFDWKDKKEISFGAGAVEKFLTDTKSCDEF